MFKSKRSKNRNIRQELDFINNLYSNETNTSANNNYATEEINVSKVDNSEDNQSGEIINMPSTSKGTNNYIHSPQMTTSIPYDQETITVSTFDDLLGNEDHNVNPFSTVSEINNSSRNSFNENL